MTPMKQIDVDWYAKVMWNINDFVLPLSTRVVATTVSCTPSMTDLEFRKRLDTQYETIYVISIPFLLCIVCGISKNLIVTDGHIANGYPLRLLFS